MKGTVRSRSGWCWLVLRHFTKTRGVLNTRMKRRHRQRSRGLYGENAWKARPTRFLVRRKAIRKVDRSWEKPKNGCPVFWEAESVGVKAITLRRARDSLRVRKIREGREYFWALPEEVK